MMDMKHRSGFRTDQPGVVPIDILNDVSLKRIQAKMAYRQPLSIEEIQKTTAKKADNKEPKQLKMMRFSSLNLIPKDFSYVGTGLYKKGHHLWSLSKEGDSFVLLRAQEEKFDEEEELEEDEENGNGEEKEAQPIPRPGGNVNQINALDRLEWEQQNPNLPPNAYPGDVQGPPAPSDTQGSRKRAMQDTGQLVGQVSTSEVIKEARRRVQSQYSPEIVSDVMNVLATYSIYLTDEGARDYIHQFRNANPDAKLVPGVVARWINEKRGGNQMVANRKKAMQVTGADGVVYRDNDLVKLLDDGKVYRVQIDTFGTAIYLTDPETGEDVGAWDANDVVLAESREYGRDATRKRAVDSTAKAYYKDYFKDYGKALTENKMELIAPIVARAYFKMMGRTMPQTLWSNRPKWAMLEKKYGKSLVKDVRSWLGEGITQIRIATVMNVRPEVALLWKPVIDKLGTKTARELRKRIMEWEMNGRRFAHSYPQGIMKSAVKAVQGERKLAYRKIAVDEVTKSYYEKYYGIYGAELVKNVRDVVMGAPKA